MPRQITPPQVDTYTAEQHAKGKDGLTDDQRDSRAVRYVATYATDADDCRMMLDMLGLLGGERKTYRTEPVSPDYASRGVSRGKSGA